MGFLINVDNGGTLTDVFVAGDDRLYHAKTLTTPYDLTQCLFEGMEQVSALIYGAPDLPRLIQNTDSLRYSTTQGTNALVERKGPLLGLILSQGVDERQLVTGASGELFGTLVGDRIQHLDCRQPDEQLARSLVTAVNHLTAAGANRLIVSMSGEGYTEAERKLKRLFLRKFPRHLLGAVPAVFSYEVSRDSDHGRRTWTSLFNSFLHPAMETFLYNTEHKFRAYKGTTPLRIFRNDGASARVAKSTAIKTYSSGPRGGMEAAHAIAAQYGLEEVISFDVGGTTMDAGIVRDGAIAQKRYGMVEGVPISFALSDIVSIGAGGGSVIRAVDGGIRVGPESVGAVPGPACFARGGTEATITDVNLLLGVLDPASYFGGKLELDAERSRSAVERNVAEPLDLSLGEALGAMSAAWSAKVAKGISDFAEVSDQTVLLAFGGGGPMALCAVADNLGVTQAVIPRLAAVFSACGISFSDIGHSTEVVLAGATDAALAQAREEGLTRLRREMYAEGYPLEECEVRATLLGQGNGAERDFDLDSTTLPPDAGDYPELKLTLTAIKALPHPQVFAAKDVPDAEPTVGGTRNVQLGPGERADVPVIRVDAQAAGATGYGPAIIEEDFFTAFIRAGWRYKFSDSRDILLNREKQS